MDIKRISEHSYAAATGDGRVFTLSSAKGGNVESLFWATQARNWEYMPQYVAGQRIVPFGSDNMLPSHLRDVMDSNNLSPGIIERQMGLLFGQGAYLSRLVFAAGKISHEWTDDKEIQSWLDSWDYVSYIKGCLTDYLHLKGFFDAKYLTRGHRIGGAKKIAYLEHIPAKNARLEWTDTRSIKDVKHIVVGDFEHYCLTTGVRVYPVYDRRDPGKFVASASYNHTYSFSRDFYSVPQYWGALRWIIRGSEIPTIFKYVTDNGINLAYHVHAPNEYWDNKREAIARMHPDWDDGKIEAEISNICQDQLRQLTETLSGRENAGKFFYTVDLPAANGTGTVKWTVEAIDQKIKDFVDSQLKISEASASAITSGMGLHPSLSNVMVNGKLASGSEMLYAFKLYLLSDTEIASSAVLEPINQAIAFNFPGKNLKLAFYHKQLEAEDALTSSARVKNQ
ncbi:MAG: hypothetical protein PUK70_01695 [Bacteroidales bacterium]|nr:hypothetical protein [Bacteroidales bacterium]MDY6002652.1 hypothetical protein [Candidatus Cryptobacteroides sp.]